MSFLRLTILRYSLKMSLHSRAFYRKWVPNVSVTSMHEVRSGVFLSNLVKPLFHTNLPSSLSVVTLEQHLYPLQHLKEFPSFYDVGFRVSKMTDYRYRVDIGLFRPTDTTPLMLGSVEQSLADHKQRTIRLPRVFRESLHL